MINRIPCWLQRRLVHTHVLRDSLAVHSLRHAPAFHDQGRILTYNAVNKVARSVAHHLRVSTGLVQGDRVALVHPWTPQFAPALFGVWQGGMTAVPMHSRFPDALLRYQLEHADARAMIVSSASKGIAERVAQSMAKPCAIVTLPEDLAPSSGVDDCSPPSATVASADDALIIFTSGTTGLPKGVLHTHASVEASVRDLVDAWQWTAHDRILHVLPLHHVHGLYNKLLCPLYTGASVEFASPSDPHVLWERLLSGDITVFQAVPTIYADLLRHPPPGLSAQEVHDRMERVRLTVSGSAACPLPVHAEWRRLTGKTLLERYGMTELGIVLSQSVKGPREAGCVGRSLPSSHVSVCREDGSEAALGEEGELRVRGATVFKEYINDETATRASFDVQGRFCTRDVARVRLFDESSGSISDDDKSSPQLTHEEVQIVGRSSVDILKVGGYKVSALEIENRLLEHERVAEVAVVGLVDDRLGQRVCAVVVPTTATTADGHTQLQTDLESHCSQVLAPHERPRLFVFTEDLGRNHMGKVNKKDLVKRIEVM